MEEDLMYTHLLPHIRRVIIQDSNRSATKRTAVMNVVPKYYYILKKYKKQTTLNIDCN